MIHLMRVFILLLASIAAAIAAPLTGNKITADGTYTVSVIPGQRYVFSAAGTFGGGSLAIQWNNGTSSSPFGQSPATSAETWSFTAPTNQVDLVLSGSTSPSITIGITLSQGSNGTEVTAADINTAVAEDPVATRNALALYPKSTIPGFWPVELTAETITYQTLLHDGSNAIREVAIVYFNSAYRIIGDNSVAADYGFPGTYESNLSAWSTTIEPVLWGTGSWTKTANVLAKTGTPGDPDRYGCATPAAVVIGSNMWVFYSGRGQAAGAGGRSACVASSTNGTSFTKHGAITGSSGALDDDFEVIHDPRTGRTYLYGTYFAANPRRPRVWTTDDTNLATATWTNRGECFGSGEPTLILPYATWIDQHTGIFWMVAGDVGGGTARVYFSGDGISYTYSGKTIVNNLHSFLIRNKWGEFAGWGTNGTVTSTALAWYRRVNSGDTSRVVVPLANTSISASGSMLFAPSRPYARNISNINFVATSSIAASGTDYWTLELRCRGVSGPTMTVTTVAGTSAYANVNLPGTFTIPAGASLQAFWTKSGSAAALGFLSVDYTEHP